MTNLTAKQIQEAYNKMPREVKDVYVSEKLTEQIQAIGKKHSLHVDQMGELVDEIGLVMLGFTPSSSFVEHIKERLKIDATTAQNIGADTNNEIFLQIREALKNLPAKPGETKEEILREIEQPTPALPSIVEQKLSGTFSLPVEKPPAADPYREPLA